MRREFESEIAKRVAEKKGRAPQKKAGALLAVVTAFALLGGTATYALAMKPTTAGNPPMTEYVLFDRMQERYLADDGSNAALRVMNLKVKGDHEIAGDNCALQDAKFNYVLKVAIYDASIDWAGMELGRLTLPADYSIDSASVLVFDSALVQIAVDDACEYISDDSNTVKVSIPSLEDGAYGEGYTIAISVVMGTELDLSDELSGEDVVEIAWGDVATSQTVTIP